MRDKEGPANGCCDCQAFYLGLEMHLHLLLPPQIYLHDLASVPHGKRGVISLHILQP